MDLPALRAERRSLLVQITGLDAEIRVVLPLRGVVWRRLFAQRIALWRRLTAIERAMVARYADHVRGARRE